MIGLVLRSCVTLLTLVGVVHHLAHVSWWVCTFLTSVCVDIIWRLLYTCPFVLRTQVLIDHVCLLPSLRVKELKVPQVVSLVVLSVTLLSKWAIGLRPVLSLLILNFGRSLWLTLLTKWSSVLLVPWRNNDRCSTSLVEPRRISWLVTWTVLVSCASFLTDVVGLTDLAEIGVGLTVTQIVSFGHASSLLSHAVHLWLSFS